MVALANYLLLTVHTRRFQSLWFRSDSLICEVFYVDAGVFETSVLSRHLYNDNKYLGMPLRVHWHCTLVLCRWCPLVEEVLLRVLWRTCAHRFAHKQE